MSETQKQNGHSFRFKLSNEDVRGLLVKHLLSIGCITPNEEKLFTGYDTNGGSGIFVEFSTPSTEKPV